MSTGAIEIPTSIDWIGPLIALAALAAGVAAAVWLLARAKSRYRELLAAVELLQRQLTELRSRFEEGRERLQRVEELLTARVEPQLAQLGRHLEVGVAAAEVRRAEEAGRLASEAARRLADHLAALDCEIAAGGRPF